MLCVAFHVTTLGVGLTATPARARGAHKISRTDKGHSCAAAHVKSSQDQGCLVVRSSPALPLTRKSKMPLNLGDVFPNFTVDTTEGRLTFHDFLGDRCSCCTSSDLASVRYPAGDFMGKGRGGGGGGGH